jgi:hypothetical protein
MFAAAIALAGCASGPKFAEQEASMPKLSADKGRVYFYRTSSPLGAAIQPNVKLDGVVVGESQPGGYFYVDAEPGSHEATTSTEVDRKASFVLDKGEVKYVRTSVGMGVLVYRVYPELVGADEAKQELPSLHYTGGPKAK